MSSGEKKLIFHLLLKLLNGRCGVWKMTKLGLQTEIGPSREIWVLQPLETDIFLGTGSQNVRTSLFAFNNALDGKQSLAQSDKRAVACWNFVCHLLH
jgi:hypothetical protein